MTNTQAAEEAFSRLQTRAAVDPDHYDPHADFKTLRKCAPVYCDIESHTWHLFAYQDNAALLQVENTTKTAIQQMFQQGFPPESIVWRYFFHILFTTPIDVHRRQHDIFHRVLVPRFRGMYPRVQKITQDVFNAAIRSGNPFEMVSQFSTLIPINVIGDWMNIAPTYYGQLLAWTQDANAILDPYRTPEQLQAATEAMEQFFAFFREQIEDRRTRGVKDLLTDLAQEMEGDELFSNATTLFIASFESVSNTISQGAIEFALRPDLLADLRAHPEFLNGLADALLRKNAATTVAYRQLLEPFPCPSDGTVIPAGAVVALWLASANRDEGVFPDPDELQLASPLSARHLAFSQGSHICIGAPLARLEVGAAFRTLVEHTIGAFQLSSYHMKPTTLFRGPLSVNVGFTLVEG